MNVSGPPGPAPPPAVRAPWHSGHLRGRQSRTWAASFHGKLASDFFGGEAELDLAGRHTFIAHGDGLTEQH